MDSTEFADKLQKRMSKRHPALTVLSDYSFQEHANRFAVRINYQHQINIPADNILDVKALKKAEELFLQLFNDTLKLDGSLKIKKGRFTQIKKLNLE